VVPGGCMYAGGESRPNGGGGGGDALRRRRQPGPSASPAASSSGRGAEEEGGEERGRGQKQPRRKKQQGRREAVARAIRGGLPSCWGGVSVAQEAASGGWRTGGRRWSRREERAAADRDARAAGDGDGDDGSGPGAGSAPAAWCCVCPGGDCSLEPNPSANGKEDVGVRSLLERNDFFSADCNPHADAVIPADAAAAYDST
jgi:hypothetical protein